MKQYCNRCGSKPLIYIRTMKGVLKEYTGMNEKDMNEVEAEKNKMIKNKQIVISETILPILKQLPPEKVLFLIIM